jgi:hypothetical protein
VVRWGGFRDASTAQGGRFVLPASLCMTKGSDCVWDGCGPVNLGRWTDEGVRPYMDIALASEINSRFLTGKERRIRNDKELSRVVEFRLPQCWGGRRAARPPVPTCR